MTTANLLNLSKMNAGKGVQTEGTKKLQEENLEVASVFSALMSNQVEMTNQLVSEGNYQTTVSKTEGVSDVTESYERFNYKENKIDVAEEKPMEETMEEVADELQQFEEKAVEAICEEYGVDEETIMNLLDEMGLSILDLLNPQNLVNFVMELTGVTSAEDLLLDDSFLNIMENFASMKTDLMTKLQITPDELNELISQMEIVNPDGEEVVEFQEELDVQLEFSETVTEETTAENLAETITESVVEADVEVTQEDLEDNTFNTNPNAEETEEGKVEVEKGQANEDVTSVLKEDKASDGQNQNEGFANREHSTPFSNTDASESMVMTNHSTVTNNTFEVPQMQTGVYTSVETMQIINQIAEQVRVLTEANTTTMEMQLNPENLGKVMLHISSEEGIVNAQFTATTEIAKEALEAQVATLRENLTQAGVKVDAIEVTIASHEFEQNLEQNHNQTEENVGQEALNNRRRNLHVDSLDELSGVMTEEETLVAQMMKENGNSVDLTA